MSENLATKITRLPQWAQSHIAALTHDLEETRDTLDSITGRVKTRVEVNPFGRGDGPHFYLPSYNAIRYFLHDGGTIDIRIPFNTSGLLDVSATGTMAQELRVQPRATNRILLSLL